MRLLAMVFCVCALGACFEEETEKAVLAPGPSATGSLAGDGGVECYDGVDCECLDCGFAFDAGAPEPCFRDEAGDLHCPSPLDAGFEAPCLFDGDGGAGCPGDAGFEAPCVESDGGDSSADGSPCGTPLEPDGAVDPYA